MGETDATLLAFDTSGPHIAGAVLHRGALLAERFEPMKRGQAENLVPILEDLLAEAGLAWRDLTALGVGIGPGNFTGIRISVSAARGLALGLGIPAVGVSTFELMRNGADGLISLEAPRDQAYLQPFAADAPAAAPRLVDASDPPADLPRGLPVIGHRAADLAAATGGTAQEATLDDIPRRLALRAAVMLSRAEGALPRPAPLYVRAPDAAPARDAPPEIVG